MQQRQCPLWTGAKALCDVVVRNLAVLALLDVQHLDTLINVRYTNQQPDQHTP